jgi:hypothetical protein
MKNDIHLKIIILSLLLLAISFISPSSLFAADVKLAWDPNDPNIDPDLAGYRVHYGNVSRTYLGGYQNSVDVENVTTYTLTGLDPSKTYYIAVTAYDTFNNQSDYSNEVKRMSFPDALGADWTWAYDSIISISDAGITLGCKADDPATIGTEAEFCPEAETTREQMAAFIVRAVEGGPIFEGQCTGQAPFSDVLATSPFCKNIERLTAIGITQGCGPNLYCPSSNVLREQMAAFIVRAVEQAEPTLCTGATFSDVTSSNPFCPHIERIAASGIALGYPDGTFRPSNPITRAEMAALITRAFLSIP